MSNVAAALAQMIECENGLGKLLPSACARRYRVANGLDPGKLDSLTNLCGSCPHGAKRAGCPPPVPQVTTTSPDTRETQRCVFCGTDYEVTNRTRGRKKYCNRCAPQRRYLQSTLAKAKRAGIVLGQWPVFDMQRTEPLSDVELDALAMRKSDDRTCTSCGGSFTAASAKQKYCTRPSCFRARRLLIQQLRKDNTGAAT